MHCIQATIASVFHLKMFFEILCLAKSVMAFTERKNGVILT